MAFVNAKYIAAIDFGTSNVSLAYYIEEEGPDCTLLSISENEKRSPTALLLENKGSPEFPKYEVVDIGSAAQDIYKDLTNDEYRSYVYFECFKMELRPQNKEISKQMKVSSIDGANFYLIEVIAFVLAKLKLKFDDELEVSDCTIKEGAETRPLKATDFSWVITVPAIWHENGKQIMRESAYRAGLLSSEVPPIDTFTPITCDLKEVEMSDCAHKLMLALEPECAALCCQQLKSSDVASYCKPTGDVTSFSYMVVDIGGGTVDVAIHTLHSNKVDSILPPTGNVWGGMKVNHEYSRMLQSIVCDPQFQRFCTTVSHHETSHKVLANMHISLTFEEKKKSFCKFHNSSLSEKKINIRLPNEMIDFYGADSIKKQLKVQYNDKIHLDGNVLVIKHPITEELFAPSVDGISDCITSALKDSQETVDKIYLVGGYGGTSYIFQKIKEKVGIPIIVPKEFTLAVVKGAILFRKSLSLNIIKSRISSASYGVEAIVKYDPKQHDKSRKIYDLSRDTTITPNVFYTLIKRNQIVLCNEVMELQSFATPFDTTKDIILVDIYKTYRDDVVYTKDVKRNPNPGVSMIGCIKLKIPHSQIPLKDRTISLFLKIGGTELNVKGVYDPTGEEVKASINFLL
ncbi:PREDICTED: heat shock 70 kDa protein 12A-like [Amphimedon queenslandica]|uniref:Uncharacterized protein n=1 Tax=Amphimedon queenslandica TaxID=400682 RepID=A0A1X7UT03_AMPQE|nr:PREDICTED: heat shock 70 kDa protein 12A-like [Amphimedon queenslandica]|eukprot:XP_011404156.1 PREDICTED: heat shock 70 kDa protein 12A-like [Amphimedon queenslandica]